MHDANNNDKKGHRCEMRLMRSATKLRNSPRRGARSPVAVGCAVRDLELRFLDRLRPWADHHHLPLLLLLRCRGTAGGVPGADGGCLLSLVGSSWSWSCQANWPNLKPEIDVASRLARFFSGFWFSDSVTHVVVAFVPLGATHFCTRELVHVLHGLSNQLCTSRPRENAVSPRTQHGRSFVPNNDQTISLLLRTHR